MSDSKYCYPLSGYSLLVLVFFSGFIFNSCKKEKEPVLSSAEKITLSSKTLGLAPYYSMGYSFEKQEFYKRITNNPIDIYLVETINPGGELTGVQFSTNTLSENTYGFYKNAEFQDVESAQAYFNNYSTAVFPENENVTLTDTVKNFQVYTFRTSEKNYVKFYVTDIRTVYTNDIADYIEVDIEYFIQRNGTLTLSE